MQNLRAIVLMIFAMAAFALSDMFVKLAAERQGQGQIVTLIAAGGGAFFLVLLAVERRPLFSRDLFHPAVLVRTLGELLGTVGMVVAITLAPITTVAAIQQAQPLVITAAAAVVFAEKVGAGRWIAVAAGFLGVLMVLRPDASGVDLGAAWALVALLGLAIRDLGSRALPDRVSTPFAASWALILLIGVGLAMVPATGGWVPIDGVHLLWTVGYVTTAAVAYLAITLAMRAGEVSAVAPFRYTRIVFAVVIGLVVFGERPDLWVWLGMALIVASGLWAVAGEHRRGARARRLTTPAP